jgi:hypothetical protein
MSLRTARRWLQKAADPYLTTNLSGGSNGGLLAPDQMKEFIRVATNAAAILPEARQEFSNSTKFEVPRISFHGVRILKSGVENTRTVDNVKPVTGLVTLSTNFFRGEVLVSDEVFEDNIEKEAHADTLMTMIAEAVGRDMEELALKSKSTATAHTDANFNDFDGLLQQLDVASAANSQVYNAAGITDVETIFANLLTLLPVRYRRDPSSLRYFVPIKMHDAWVDALSARGSVLGDAVLVDGKWRAFRGIPIIPVPLFSGNEAGIGSIDYTKYGFLTHPKNIIVGFHRKVRMEKYRDPLSGGTSFLPTVRFDIKCAETDMVTFTKTIDSI